MWLKAASVLGRAWPEKGVPSTPNYQEAGKKQRRLFSNYSVDHALAPIVNPLKVSLVRLVSPFSNDWFFFFLFAPIFEDLMMFVFDNVAR